MDALFRKYFWLINGALLVVVAFLAARLVISYVEYGVLFVPWSGAVENAAAGDNEEVSFRSETFGRRVNKSLREEIVKNSGAPETEEVVETTEPVEEEEPEEEPMEEEPAGSFEIEFLAAIVTEEAASNMAFLKIDNGDGRWVAVGTELLNGVVASEITRTMFRASDGTVKYLWEKTEPKKDAGSTSTLASLTNSKTKKTGPGGRPARPSKTTSRPGRAGKGMEGVTKVDDFEYHIDRGLLDEKLQDLGALGREARVIPNYDRESGSYKGFKLIGVRPNSLYRNIGIRSGDVILQVNGEEMNSPSKALELFTKLQTSNEISLDIKRRGKVETLVYKIQ